MIFPITCEKDSFVVLNNLMIKFGCATWRLVKAGDKEDKEN